MKDLLLRLQEPAEVLLADVARRAGSYLSQYELAVDSRALGHGHLVLLPTLAPGPLLVEKKPRFQCGVDASSKSPRLTAREGKMEW